MNEDEQEIGELCPDCIILDEFLRCGIQRWSQGIGRLPGRFAQAKWSGCFVCWENRATGAYDAKWEKRFAQAKTYFETHGDLQVPAAYKTEDGFGLGMWITNQRKAKQGKLPGCELTWKQIDRLEAIGMQWEATHAVQWQHAYRKARACFESNGNLDVPYTYCTSSGFMLGRWVRRRCSAMNALGRSTNTRMTIECNKAA